MANSEGRRKNSRSISTPATDRATVIATIVFETGWTLDYIKALTYRALMCLYERYWAKIEWEIEVNIKTNPMASFDDEKTKTKDNNTIDLDQIDDISYLKSLGIPVKEI